MIVQELRSKVSVVLGHRHDTTRVLDGNGSLDQAAFTVNLVTLDCRVTRLGRGCYGMVFGHEVATRAADWKTTTLTLLLCIQFYN